MLEACTMQVLTTSTVARRLQVSESTVRNLVRSGLLKAARTESGIRIFDPADVDQAYQARIAAALPRPEGHA